ncbi:type VII secretion system-associated protein [Actinopolyspora mortivallis]|nr:type VII secretion system-associated protein [Actinopolyspora mortivallis]
MSSQQPSRPAITPAMREQAAQQPNSWLYVVDPIFTDPNAEVPPWGFIGGFRVDEHGRITEDFSPNPNYRPSPVALRLPAPTNDVERALQLTTTGYAPAQTLLAALLETELILFAQPQGDGLFTLNHHSGRKQLQVFTSEAQLPGNWTSWQRMTGRSLAGMRPLGTDLQVNPNSVVKVRVPAEDLIRAAGLPVTANHTTNGTSTAAETTVRTDVSTITTPGRPTTSTLSSATSRESPSSEAAPDLPSPPQHEERERVGDDPFGERFLGSLLATAAGDALGAPVEFYPLEQIRSRYGTDGVTDYDRNTEHPGAFTDDTQLTLFTLEGMIRGHLAVRTGVTENPLPAIQLGLQRWLHTQGYSWERAAGPFLHTHPEPDGWLVALPEFFAVRSPASSNISALREFVSSERPGSVAEPLGRSETNGGMLRALPAALWSRDPHTVFEMATACAALTHGAPEGCLPAGVLGVLLRQLWDGQELATALARAREVLAEYAPDCGTEQALARAVELAEHGTPTPERLKDVLGAGWTAPEALAIAVCAVSSTENLARAVLLAVNHSGDSDSTGAVCGALAGAMYGKSALPGVWLRDLRQRETVEDLGRDALREFGTSPPDDEGWRQRYPGHGDVSSLGFDPTFGGPVSAEPSSPTGSAEAEEVSEHSGTESSAERSSGASSAAAAPPDSAVGGGWFRGPLLGGAVGDALGYLVEFDPLAAIRGRFGPAGVTGFPEKGEASAVVSDDTQMTLFTLEGVIRAGTSGRLGRATPPVETVQHAYQRWLHTQGFDWKEARGPAEEDEPDGWLIGQRELFKRRAPGTTCIQALHGFGRERRAGSVAAPLNDSKGCGGVMRAAPVALWSTDRREVFRVAAESAALTHGHPSGYLPAGAFAVIVRVLLDGFSLQQALDTALGELSRWDEHQETTACLKRAAELAAAGERGPETIEQRLGGGWVGEEALGIAVYAALTHPDSFTDAVLLAVNHSGDSDSTGSVCGTVMGAALSADSIPEEWVRALDLRETIERIAADAELEFGSAPPEDAEWLRRYPLPPGERVAETSGADGEAPPRTWLPVRDTASSEESEAQRTSPRTDEQEGEAIPDTEEHAPPPEEHAPTDTDVSPSDSPASPSAETEDAGKEEDPSSAEDAPPEGERHTEEPPPTEEAAENEPLSAEESRLLSAWRRIQEGDGDVPTELYEGLRALAVDTFGAEEAARLLGTHGRNRNTGALAEESPLELDPDQRLRGCVLGTLCGDVLGTPLMFTTDAGKLGADELEELVGTDGRGSCLSQQLLFVLHGVLRAELRRRLHDSETTTVDNIRTSLRQWLGTQGVVLRRPPLEHWPGETPALRAQRFPDHASLAALADPSEHGTRPGPLNPPNDADGFLGTARAAPLGLFAPDPAVAFALGAESAVLTHGSPDGYLPAGMLAGMVNALLRGTTLAEATRRALAELDKYEGGTNTAEAVRSAVRLAENGPPEAAALSELGSGWRAPEALAIALAAALSRPDSWREAVTLAASHPGNSAATSAVCGGLLGVSRGEEALPAEWVERLELREVAETLLADRQRLRDPEEPLPDEETPEWTLRYLGGESGGNGTSR